MLARQSSTSRHFLFAIQASAVDEIIEALPRACHRLKELPIRRGVPAQFPIAHRAEYRSHGGFNVS